MEVLQRDAGIGFDPTEDAKLRAISAPGITICTQAPWAPQSLALCSYLHHDMDRMRTSRAIAFGDPDWRTEFAPKELQFCGAMGLWWRSGETHARFSSVMDCTPPGTNWIAHTSMASAMWTYLTTPFPLTMPGVEVSETQHRAEQGETWRVLHARFPNSIATHSTEQDFYFDDSCLLKRHDYNVDVAGGFEAAQLVFDYIEADGIRLASKQRAYTRAADGTPNLNDLMVPIDLTNASFS